MLSLGRDHPLAPALPLQQGNLGQVSSASAIFGRANSVADAVAKAEAFLEPILPSDHLWIGEPSALKRGLTSRIADVESGLR